MICKNCTTEFEGNFCPNCGQKASVRRFTLKIAFAELVEKLLPLDKGILFTTWELLRRPGAMIRGYLAGKRMNYTKPLHFLLLVLTISLVFFSREKFEEGFAAGYGSNPGQAKFQKEWIEFIFSNFSLVYSSMVPFLAVFSKWLFRKSGYNFAEHLVLNCYLMAGSSLVSIPLAAAFRFIESNPYTPNATLLSMAVMLSYYAYGMVGFYQPKKKVWAVIKALLVYLFAYLAFILVIGVMATIAIIVYVAIYGKEALGQ